MDKREHGTGVETDWTAGSDLHNAGTAFELETFRRTLEEETRTLAGFRRRVRTEREWSILPLIVGVPIVLLQAAFALSAIAAGETGLTTTAAGWLLAGLVLVAISIVAGEVRIRREFGMFQRDGWIGLQAPTGLVELSTDGAGALVYDHRSIGGAALYRARDLREPVVLVAGPGQPVAAFADALGTARRSVVARLYGKDDLDRLRQQLGRLKSVPSDGWFAGTPGLLVGRGDSRFVVAAIPREWKGERRIRLGSIRLRPEEASRFSGRIATPAPGRGAAEVPVAGPLATAPAGAASTAARSKRNRAQFVVLIVAMMAVGPTMIGIGTALTAQEDTLRSTGTRVEGTVSDVDDGRRASDQRFTVDYVADDSSSHSTRVSWSSDTKPSVGDSETVIYDPTDPGRALVAGYDGDAISIAGLGLIFTVIFWAIGAVGLFGRRKRRAKSRAAAAG